LFERLNIVAEPASDAQGAALVGAVPLEQPAEYRSAPA
jgi:hypothetical protein